MTLSHRLAVGAGDADFAHAGMARQTGKKPVMKRLSLFLPIAMMAAAPLPALAASGQSEAAAKTQSRAFIPFANRGGVWNLRAEGNRTLYFEDNHKTWYKAELMGFSPDLPFVEFIAIDTRPNGTLDRWSAVYIHGQRYPFVSFEKLDAPPGKHKVRNKAKG